MRAYELLVREITNCRHSIRDLTRYLEAREVLWPLVLRGMLFVVLVVPPLLRVVSYP